MRMLHRPLNVRIRKYGQAAFDTHLLAKRLAEGGLNAETASVLTSLLNPALSAAIKETSQQAVIRPDFEREMSSHNVELHKLKNELALRQTEAYQSSKHSLEQLLRELRTSRQRSREALGSIRSEMRLEINLERGRQRDSALQAALKFQDLQTKSDAETGNAYAALAKLRHDIFYSLTGFLFTSIAALFGFLRLAAL